MITPFLGLDIPIKRYMCSDLHLNRQHLPIQDTTKINYVMSDTMGVVSDNYLITFVAMLRTL